MSFWEFYFLNFTGFVAKWWWLILPFYLFPILYSYWVYHLACLFYKGNKFAVLTIRVPREQERSPKLMENVIQGIWTLYGNVRNFMETLSWGIFNDSVSLEIVGAEGKVYFGVWVLEENVDFIKSHIYAQYPDAEIEKAKEDYLQLVPDDIPNKEWNSWGTMWTMMKSDAFPIRTYPEFEDFVTGTMVDPLASYMEILSDLGPGEYLWYQLLLEPLGDDVWLPEFEQQVEKILDRGRYKERLSVKEQLKKDWGSFPQDTVSAAFKYPEIEVDSDKNDFSSAFIMLSPGEQDSVKAIERSISKRGFRAQYATLYIARRESFRFSNIPSMMGAVNQFNTADLNGFNIYYSYMTSSTYWLSDLRVNFKKRRLLRLMKNREFSGVDHVLNTEEIASLWHFPDMTVKAVQTPRVTAKRATAPVNLPKEEQ